MREVVAALLQGGRQIDATTGDEVPRKWLRSVTFSLPTLNKHQCKPIFFLISEEDVIISHIGDMHKEKE